VPDEAPPQGIGGDFGRQWSGLREGGPEQRGHVEAGAVEYVEVVGEEPQVLVGPNLLGQVVGPGSRVLVGAGRGPEAALQCPLVSFGIGSGLAWPGGSGVVVLDGVRGAPHREVTE